MNTLTVIHLVMVILSGTAEPRTEIRRFDTINECKAAETALHDAAKTSVGLIDIGTICVKSEFDLRVKPAA